MATDIRTRFYHVTFSNNSAAVLQQAIARMLFWGQQGVSPNIQKAVRHYERGAVQWEDPGSMYDYGIVLLQVRITSDDEKRDNLYLKLLWYDRLVLSPIIKC